jgi:hypothetical protein
MTETSVAAASTSTLDPARHRVQIIFAIAEHYSST